MNTVDRIFELMNHSCINAAQLTREASLTNGLVTQWKQGKQKPSIDAMVKIADYFKVSVDYLLTGQEPLPPDVTAEEMELLKKLRNLPPEKRKAIEALLD